jgi:2-polyprenyl-6-methoxyphenol hydroxylase-like FAD-dependent oxidoreductase
VDRVVRSAVVVGAGVGGLAVAGALARTGWQVTLLERADRVRPGRAALLLWPNGVRALQALGLGDGLDAIATPVPPTGLRRPDGQWLRQPGASGARADSGAGSEAASGAGSEAASGAAPGRDARPVVVHREDLHDAFVAGLGDHVDIRTGVTVRAARPGPDRPSVADGRTTWEADLVIAADGVDSVVRQRLAPSSRPVSAGFAAWRAVIPGYRAPKLAGDTPPAGETLGIGHRFGYVELTGRAASHGGFHWTAIAPGAARPEPPAAQLALLRRWFAGWHSPVTELLAATEPDDLVQERVVDLSPMPDAFAVSSGTGGYALLGAAAHAVVDPMGVATSLALEDAATLRALLMPAIPGRNLDAALDSYGSQRRARVLRLARQSRRLSAVLQARGGLAVRARELAFGSLAPKLMDAVAAEAVAWQPVA